MKRGVKSAPLFSLHPKKNYHFLKKILSCGTLNKQMALSVCIFFT